MDKRIIINADDFGLSSAVNKAVAKAHKEGILTSTTIMANMPAAKDAVKTAKKLPNLGVGVHLNLTKGRPLSKDSSVECLLNKDGDFTASTIKLSVLSTVSHNFRKAIRAELAAQIQWVIDKGLSPTHLDSHHHIHCYPPIFTIVCDLARRFKIGAVRWAFEPKPVSAIPWPLPGPDGRKTAKVLRTMANINRLQNPDFLKTDAFLCVTHLGRIDINFFKAVTLYNTAQTAEVMTHPALAGGEPVDATSAKYRENELDALCSERTKEFFKEAEIKLVHYGELE